MLQKKKVTIAKTIENCIAAGYKVPDSKKSIHSELEKTTSLIGMAYLNYIYQNDLENSHFCESMMLMNSQVPKDIPNPFVHLFEPALATHTMVILEDIQLSFDYSIARTNPPMEKLQASIATIESILKKAQFL